MFVRVPGDARRRLDALKGSLVGVGLSGFGRSSLAGAVPGYRVVCLRKTDDLPALREKMEVFCLEEEGVAVEGIRDSLGLLSHPRVREYLAEPPSPVHLLLYQSYSALESLAKKEGWRLLANPAALRHRASDRAFFQAMLRDLGLPRIPGRIVSLAGFLGLSYDSWRKGLGPSLVVQLPDVIQGGGRSTFFVNSGEEYARVSGMLRDRSRRGDRIRRVSVRRFMKGDPASLALCVTGSGVLMAGPQRQLIDFPLSGVFPSEGVFCGHSWEAGLWEEELIREGQAQGLAVARYLASMGYKGILGLDLLLNRQEDRVYPVELNPRYTGAFPLLSQLHSRRGLVTLELAHVLAFLGLDRGLTVEDLNVSYLSPGLGSHVILFRGLEGLSPDRPGLRAGLYEMGGAGPRFLGEGFDLADIASGTQFIVTDGPAVGPASERYASDPFDRICRILLPVPAAGTGGAPDSEALAPVDWVRGMLRAPRSPERRG